MGCADRGAGCDGLPELPQFDSARRLFRGDLRCRLRRSCGLSAAVRRWRRLIGRNCRVVPTNPVGVDWWLCNSGVANRTAVFATYDGEPEPAPAKAGDGKAHSDWRLARSVRRGRKEFQETVADLGELDAQGRARARRLALEITGGCEQYDLFEATAVVGEPVAVRLGQVRLERTRCFGDVWLGWRLWCALGLDRFCAEQMAEGRERVPWASMAAILVIARLCEPSSELHIAEDWYRRTAL